MMGSANKGTVKGGERGLVIKTANRYIAVICLTVSARIWNDQVSSHNTRQIVAISGIVPNFAFRMTGLSAVGVDRAVHFLLPMLSNIHR